MKLLLPLVGVLFLASAPAQAEPCQSCSPSARSAVFSGKRFPRLFKMLHPFKAARVLKSK